MSVLVPRSSQHDKDTVILALPVAMLDDEQPEVDDQLLSVSETENSLKNPLMIERQPSLQQLQQLLAVDCGPFDTLGGGEIPFICGSEPLTPVSL